MEQRYRNKATTNKKNAKNKQKKKPKKPVIDKELRRKKFSFEPLPLLK